MYAKNRFYAAQGWVWDVVSQIGSGLGAGLSAAANYGQSAQAPSNYSTTVVQQSPSSGFSKYLPWMIGGVGVLGILYLTTRK